jgi:chemotaxis response regulator CheB
VAAPAAHVEAQHMSPRFTQAFAERLDRGRPLEVREARDGAGFVRVAPGGPVTTIAPGARTWSCARRPRHPRPRRVILAQSPDAPVIPGMSEEAIGTGAVTDVLPAPRLARAIERFVKVTCALVAGAPRVPT